MKKLALSLAILCASLAHAQTVVTGTFKDTNGVAYAGATLTITQTTAGGSTFQLSPSPPNLSSTGAYAYNIIAVSGSTYTFTASIAGVAPPAGTGPQTCKVSGVTISGSTQTVGSSSCAVLLASGGASGAAGGALSGTYPNPTAGQPIAPNQQYWYLVPVSQGCGGLTNCTTIYADAVAIIDGTSNSTTTFSCPNNDCNFTSADVGKTFWATTQGTGTAGSSVNTTYVCPVTTIQTVNSASSVTLGTACTASGSGNVQAIWGHRDGTILHGLDGNGIGCFTIIPPSGLISLIDQAEFITPSGCGNPSGGQQLQTGFPSKNFGGVVPNFELVLTPDFNWTTCTGNGGTHTGSNVCIGTGLNQMNDTLIWGTGLTQATLANCANGAGKTVLALNPNGGSMTGVNVAGICPGNTNAIEGVELNSLDEYWLGGGAQYVGEEPCVVSSVVTTEILDCRADAYSGVNGLTIASGGWDTDTSSFPFVGVNLQTGGTLSSRGAHIIAAAGSCGIAVNGGTWYSYGDIVGVDGNTSGLALCFTSSGGVAQSLNTVFNSTGTAISFQAGTFTSLGGNTVTGPGIVTFSTTAPAGIVGWDVLQGSCTGTVSSAATIGLFNLGNNTTTACTSTTTGLGPVMGKAGNVYALACSAGTAGNQTADACTVLKNHQGTTTVTSMTCSLNGATFCMDGATAHQFTYAIGDIITVKVVSGTSTTLANVKASVLAW